VTTIAGATLRVYTYKEGVLSAVAHDLEIEVARFSLDVSADGVSVDADASSLRVVHPMKDGRPNPRALSRRDFAKIEKSIASDVLRTRRHPRVLFTAPLPTDDDTEVTGTLTLCGEERQVRLRLSRTDTVLQARARIQQPDFGITPFTAMLGTLKIKPAVDVLAEVPLDALRDETPGDG
jgi:hypothetical protein